MADDTKDEKDMYARLGVERDGLEVLRVRKALLGRAYELTENLVCRRAPRGHVDERERVACAVMMQPIGLENNRPAFYEMFGGWVDDVRGRHPEADDAVWDRFRDTMFGGPFLFNATREQVAAIDAPLLVLRGDDLYHPESISRAVVALAKNARLVERWKDEEHVDRADAAIRELLAAHAG